MQFFFARSFKRVTVLDFWIKIWNQKKREGEMKGKERLRQMTHLLRLLSLWSVSNTALFVVILSIMECEFSICS